MRITGLPTAEDGKIILGIDPGSNIMGYALLQAQGKEPRLLEYGIRKFDSDLDHLVRVKQIFEFTTELINRFLPDELAIEAPFFGKNVQAMLKLGRAQGAAISAALCRQIPVIEYPPKRVKQSVTGNGNASKEQVAYMMKAVLGIAEVPSYDASDALAIALCHFNANHLPIRAAKSWDSFIAKNPDRVKA